MSVAAPARPPGAPDSARAAAADAGDGGAAASADPSRRGALRPALWVSAGVALLLALTLWGTLREPDNDRRAQAATTYSSGPSGAKALYLLLEQSGFQVTRLRSLEYAREDSKRVLWILTPGALPVGDAELLVDFLKGGGTAVAPAPVAADLLQRAGAAGARAEKIECPHGPCALATTAKLVLSSSGGSLQTIVGAEPTETFAWAAGNPLVARYAIDEGSVVSIGGFEMLRNDAIGSGDGGPFWVGLAGALGASHAFDEVHTGYGDLNVLTLIWRAPYRWAAIDLAFVLAVAVWGFGGRERRARRDPRQRRRETKDHVQAVADWWGRSGDLGLPLTALMVALDARASGRLQTSGERRFVAWASAVQPELGARAADAWARAEQLLAKKRTPAREVVTVASALRALEREVFPC